MTAYNYTGVKRREKRLYRIFNTTISSTGIVTSTIYMSLAMLLLFALPGMLVCKITGKFWYNPLNIISESATGWFYLFFVALPIGIGIALNTWKIQNYKVIDYLKMYFTPKHMIDHNGKRVTVEKISIDTFIEKI